VNELRIPKRRVEVDVFLGDGVERRLAVFLADAASGHAGPERVIDLLNDDATFLPAIERDAVVFLRRDAIHFVRLVDAEEAPSDPTSPFATALAIHVELVGGRRLGGVVRFSLPPERCRLVDFLESAPTFFRLEEGAAISFVNKGHVARVTLQGD